MSWSIGDLAQASGLSVRVLRHWEQQGLISSARTGAGHRRYGRDQVTRLYRAVALRRTGLRLAQIGALLASHYPAPATTLRAHLAELDDDLERRARLRGRLAAVLAAFEDDVGLADPDLPTSDPVSTLVARHPGAHITAVDVSESSRAQARQRLARTDTVEFAQADVYDLPRIDGTLAAGTFDHVFVCFCSNICPNRATR